MAVDAVAAGLFRFGHGRFNALQHADDVIPVEDLGHTHADAALDLGLLRRKRALVGEVMHALGDVDRGQQPGAGQKGDEAIGGVMREHIHIANGGPEGACRRVEHEFADVPAVPQSDLLAAVDTLTMIKENCGPPRFHSAIRCRTCRHNIARSHQFSVPVSLTFNVPLASSGSGERAGSGHFAGGSGAAGSTGGGGLGWGEAGACSTPHSGCDCRPSCQYTRFRPAFLEA